jgi:FlaG/FlaF family flagellin (archaellin)
MTPLQAGRKAPGVSPLVATVMLVILTLLLFGIYVLGITGGSTTPTQPLQAVVRAENVEGRLVVRHVVGDEIPKAFRLSNGAVTWVNLVVRRNGENLSVTGGARVGNLTTGMVDFGPGTRLELPVSVGRGDRITVVYVPAGQTLCEQVF